MRLLIQRTTGASLAIDGTEYSHIGAGLLVLVGVENADGDEDIDWLAHKLINLRIFNDPNGVMNLDVTTVGGEIMIVSQFTLFASTRKGNRPSYIRSAKEDIARPLYERFVTRVEELLERPVATGVFGADMKISFVNDGPVTIMIDSKMRE